jgi:phosphoglycerate dehydrogenase-like enzyme
MSTILLGFSSDQPSQPELARLQELAPDARLLVTDQPPAMEAALDEVEIAAGPIPPELIVRAPHLRWYQQWGAGADWLLRYPEAVGRPFVLTNVSGIHAIPISEHILAFMLAFARALPASIRAQEQHRWSHGDSPKVFELAGRTLLLIGVGAIGRRTAELAQAMGMHVVGVRRNPGAAIPGIDLILGPDRLNELLPQADFVVLTVPLTPETRGLIARRELRALKDSAYIINIGRGEIIDEDALVEALREGRVAGAGLDVFATEPLPEGSPLWSMSNVIVTAHYAGLTPFYNQRAMAIFLDNLRRYREGEPLQHVVDKERGY